MCVLWCAVKTSPCVLSTRPHVFTHVDVLPVHTETFPMYTRSEIERSGRAVRMKRERKKRVLTCTRGSPTTDNNHLILLITSLTELVENNVLPIPLIINVTC